MVRHHPDDEPEKGDVTEDGAEKGDLTDGSPPEESLATALVDRRSLLKVGAAAVAGSVGAAKLASPASAAIDVREEDGYEVWTISGKEVYDLSNGEELSNVLVDQTASGACLTIRSRNRTGWTVRNVGFVGVGQVGGGANAFQFQVSVPSGGYGLIENVWTSGKARNGQPSTELGGIYLRPSHAGHIDIRHTYIEGFGNNAVYGSAVGKDGGSNGSVTCENCYHRDNTVSQFRIGSPESVVRNCVGVVDDPNGDRGVYPGTSSNRNARGIWGKHFRNQRIENSAFYVSPNDVNPDGVFEARYISGRSNGPEAVVNVVDCNVNSEAPSLTGSTSNARVEFSNLAENPTVEVIGGGGVPMTPEMAARGEREMPPELPGADGGSDGGSGSGGDDDSGSGDDDDSGSDSDGDDPSNDLDRTLAIVGNDGGRTDYAFTVSDSVENDPNVGSFDADDAIDGNTVTGFVNGGVDGYRFAGEITDATVDGDAAILVDGQEVDVGSLPGAGDDGSDGSQDDGSDGSDSGRDHELVVRTTEDPSELSYEFTTSGEVEKLLDRGDDSAENNDVVTENGDGTWTVSGYTGNGYGDAFAFDGEVVGFSPTTGPFVVLLDGEEVDPGSFGDGGDGGDSETLPHTLTIDGNGAGWTDYAFTVSDSVENNEDVGSFGGGDAIDGNTVTGFVNGGVDGYRFAGEITDATVDGDAAILVDGQEVDADALGDDSDDGSDETLPRSITIDGSDGGQAEYEFAVTGEVQPDGGAVDGSTAAGSVEGDADSYHFSGDLVGISVDGDATVLVDGDEADPNSLGLPNGIVFDGSESQSETTYQFQVSGDLAGDPLLHPLESGDVIEGSSVTGSVTGERDAYRFSGKLVGLRVHGEASVSFEEYHG